MRLIKNLEHVASNMLDYTQMYERVCHGAHVTKKKNPMQN